MRRALAIVLFMAAAARGDDWPHLGRDDARGRTPAESLSGLAPAADLALSPAAASPVAADGILVLAGLDGSVRALRESDLAPLWSASLPSSVLSTPAVQLGRVYVACGDGALYAFRLADGAPLWTAPLGGATQSSPVVSAGRVLVAAGFPATSLVAVDAATGAPAWSAPLGQVSWSSPAVAGSSVLIPTNAGKLRSHAAADGASAWEADLSAVPAVAAPLILGPSAFLLAEGLLNRAPLDPIAGPAGLQVGVLDPAPPPAALGVDRAASSLALAGGRLVGVVRFDYAMDLDGDPFGTADARILREVAFSADPDTLAFDWIVLLAQGQVPDQNAVPPYRMVPSPVACGSAVAFASSAAASLILLDAAGGTISASFALDTPCLASPVAANGRLLALSSAGRLHVFQGANAMPLVSGLSPDGIEVDVPGALSWTASEAGLDFIVRFDDDGEILMDWDLEIATTALSIPCPALADGFWHAWGVRARDGGGARGPWRTATIGQNVPPQPPAGFSGIGKHRKVLLSWTASPSPDVASYRLSFGPPGGPMGPESDRGLALSAVIGNLANGVAVEFRLRALDSSGDYSAPLAIVVAPVGAIRLAGVDYDTIEAAAAAAAPNQTIELGSDVLFLSGPLVLPQAVHLVGVNAHVTRVVGPGGAVPIVDATGFNQIRLLSLTGGGVGVLASGHGVSIRNVVIHDLADAAVDVPVGGDVEVINATLARNGGPGVRSVPPGQVRNSILQQNAVGLSGPLDSSYNSVPDGYDRCRAGAGDRDAVVAFLDDANADFREQPQQPSLDAGKPADDFRQEPPENGGRINMGAFGNTPLAAASLAPAPPPPDDTDSGCFARSAPVPGPWGLAALAGLSLLLRRRRP